jgi:hypothetical protein
MRLQLANGAVDFQPGEVRFKAPGGGYEMKFGNSSALPRGLSRSATVVTRFQSSFRERVPAWQEVEYQNAWPGIAVRFSWAGGVLKSDYCISPHADAGALRVEYKGASEIQIDPEGGLRVKSGSTEIRESIPEVYQWIEGKRVLRSAKYKLFPNHVVGFEIHSFDPRYRLIIDPVVVFSTYLGATPNLSIQSVATDSAGNIYLTGWTDAYSMPLNSAPGIRGSGIDAFVAKLNPSGSSLLYFAFIGGSGDDRSYACAVDSAGTVWITGGTSSSDFPIRSGFQTAKRAYKNAFIARLNSSGTDLLWSSYFGGTWQETGRAIAVSSSGNVFVAGESYSQDLPTSGFSTMNAGWEDAFVIKLLAGGSSPVICVLLGGQAEDYATTIAVDPQENIYVAGATRSPNFPTLYATQPNIAGNQDAWLAKISSSGGALLASTYLGGAQNSWAGLEAATAIKVDSSGQVYVAGVTPSPDFPVVNAAQALYGGGSADAFVAKYSSDLRTRQFSTFLGGGSHDQIQAMAVMSAGVEVVGFTASWDFPLMNSLQSPAGGYDAFVAELSSNGTLSFSTVYGGAAADQATSVTTDPTGALIIAGQTTSFNFPVAQPLQTSNGGMTSGFVLKLRSSQSCSYSVSPGSYTAAASGGSFSFSVTTSSGCGWNATSQASWISIQNSTSGTGSGSVPVNVDANSTYTQRTGGLTIAGQAITLTQPGQSSCSYSVAPQSIVSPATGGSATITVTAAVGCAWTASTSTAWVHVQSGTSGSGNGSSVLSVDANVGSARSGALTIAGQTVSVSQPSPVVAGARPARIAAFIGGQWSIDMNNNFSWDNSITDRLTTFGQTGWIPVVGDWNGSGTTSIGAFQNGVWRLDWNGNGVWDGPAIDKEITFGATGDSPIVGDWDGSGVTKIGVYQAGVFKCDFNGNFVYDGPTVDRTAFFGGPGYLPVIGDWNGSGTAKIGAFLNGTWILDYNGNFAWDGLTVDRLISFGTAGSVPVVGDWSGNKVTKIGVYNSGSFLVDYNGNFVYDGPTIDRNAYFGGPGYKPVIGDWNGSGTDKIGAFLDGTWILDRNGSFGWEGPPLDVVSALGAPGSTGLVLR